LGEFGLLYALGVEFYRVNILFRGQSRWRIGAGVSGRGTWLGKKEIRE
jgi:hypothetical protein